MTTTMVIQHPQHGLGSFSVIDPRSGVASAAQTRTPGSVAARVDSLDGKVVAVIDNGLGSAQGLAAALIDRLRDQFELEDVIWARKPSVSVPPRPGDWADIVDRADVGIALFGGCGSCSSRTMRDAIEMEWAGIPAVPIIHEALLGSAEAMRKMSKMADYPLVQVSYPASPTAPWDAALLSDVLDSIVPMIVARLVSVSPS